MVHLHCTLTLCAYIIYLCQCQYTPLHLAAGKGRHKVIILLLEKGANIHCKDNEGNTPLHKAAANNHSKAVAVLVQMHANSLLANKVLDRLD